MTPFKELLTFITNIMLVAVGIFAPCFYLAIKILAYFDSGSAPLTESAPWLFRIFVILFVLLAVTNIWLRRRRAKLTGILFELVCTQCGHRRALSGDIHPETLTNEHCPNCHSLMVLARTPIEEITHNKK